MNTPDYSSDQAKRVIAKFGSAATLAKCLGVHRSTVYRWTWPVSKFRGTGGIIPTSAVRRVKLAARLEGIVLTDADWRV